MPPLIPGRVGIAQPPARGICVQELHKPLLLLRDCDAISFGFEGTQLTVAKTLPSYARRELNLQQHVHKRTCLEKLQQLLKITVSALLTLVATGPNSPKLQLVTWTQSACAPPISVIYK
eukprot:6491203-Amphidinium_carterae.1